MEIFLIGKPPSDIISKPKRAPKQKKVETINSDSDSEFGIPKKTTAPKGKERLSFYEANGSYFGSLNSERLFFSTFLYSSASSTLKEQSQVI